MEVEHYSFGRIRIAGKDYTSDVIVSRDYVKDGWWRKEGHRVQLPDVGDILRLKPEVVVFGTGANGLVRVDREVVERLRDEGAEVLVADTRKAVNIYNDLLRKGKKVVLAAHLTC